MLRAPLRAALVGLTLFGIALTSLEFLGCGSGDTPRKGAAGESCTRTDDCAEPLACIDKVCAGSTGTGGGTGTGGSAGVGGFGPSADAGPWGMCDQCLDEACATELAACDAECRALQACIETVCYNLSAIDAPKEEGSCQVKCQQDHAEGKQKHLDVVNCAVNAPCLPPCSPFPTDDTACRSFMNKGDCKVARAACLGNADCQTYADCVSTCTTFKECIACDDSPSGQAGRALLEAYQLCIAGECILMSWIPPI